MTSIDDAKNLWAIFGVMGTFTGLIIMFWRGASGDIAGAIGQGGNMIANAILYGGIGFLISSIIGAFVEAIGG